MAPAHAARIAPRATSTFSTIAPRDNAVAMLPAAVLVMS